MESYENYLKDLERIANNLLGKYTVAFKDQLESLEAEFAEQRQENSRLSVEFSEKEEQLKQLIEKEEQSRRGTFTDTRDGRVYKTIKIGNQVWMAENLNYNIKSFFGSEKSEGYSDPNEDEKYGRLYNWEAAKKAVPPGWHLPTSKEWNQLFDYVNVKNGDHNEGDSLKAKSGWKESDNGKDRHGFTALPGGYGFRAGKFFTSFGIGNEGVWWSSTELSGDSIKIQCPNMTRSPYVVWGDYDKNNFLNIRCIKN